MAWTMRTSVRSVPGKARQGSDSPAAGESVDAAGGRVRLIIDMEGGFVGTVDIATDAAAHDVWVEVHLSNGGADGEGGS